MTAANGEPSSWPRRTGSGLVGLYFRGVCMGAADVVPGVSGGTMAFILGIYEELVDSIRAAARPPFLRALLRLRVREALEALNAAFLLALGAGIATAILSLARGISWLLEHQREYVWSFFFGLVLASVAVVSDRIERWTPGLIAILALGAGGAYVVVGLVPVQTPNAPWFLFVSGALAICAMILPGISGAFILVLLGKYQYVLDAVNNRDVLTVAYLMAGIVVGIVSFAQVLGWLFHRHHDLTVALLTGFMLGSLRKVWPWKLDLASIVDSHGRAIPTVQENVLPHLHVGGSFNLSVPGCVGLALFGFGLVLVLERWARSKQAAVAA